MRSILVVEDEPLISAMTTEILEDEGYRVLTAADAREAIRVVQSEKIDLLFTDLDLALGTNGLVLAREARRVDPEVKVVYTSGGCRSVTPQDAVPGSLFVPKPYRPAQLCSLISAMLNGAPAR